MQRYLITVGLSNSHGPAGIGAQLSPILEDVRMLFYVADTLAATGRAIIDASNVKSEWKYRNKTVFDIRE